MCLLWHIYHLCKRSNVIDHSEGSSVNIRLKRTALDIEIRIIDNGIGIFNKIQKELNLDDPMYSILELAKGKFTTDPKRHTGEGVFFTSRVFDTYSIWSGNLYFAHLQNRDWLLENKKEELSWKAIGEPAFLSGFQDEITLNNGQKFAALNISRDMATSPGFPFIVELKPKTDTIINIKGVMRAVARDKYGFKPVSNGSQSDIA